MAEVAEVLYRYNDPEEPERVGAKAYLSIFQIDSHTPKGYWICGKKRFVLADAHKKFAHESIEAAKESYRRRKMQEVRILEARLERAQLCKTIALAGQFESPENKGVFIW